jgi:hypothetical protein
MRVKSARSIRKGASSGQTAASLVENHARKPPSSALIANHASKPALFEVPFGVPRIEISANAHCTSANDTLSRTFNRAAFVLHLFSFDPEHFNR